jgi:hypothetical protein
MTDLTESTMTEPTNDHGSNGRYILWMMVSGLGIVMTSGAVAGYLAKHYENGGGPLGTAGTIVMIVFAAIIGSLIYVLWRNGIKIRASSERLGRREKLNQRVMVGSGLLGAMIAIALLASSTLSGNEPSMFANTPIEPWLAILLAAIVGIGVPILSWYWHHRIIDEQEADAYRSGALIAAYVYWILAPTWWLLWRGRLVPSPDGVAIYMITMVVATAIWFSKKYR